MDGILHDIVADALRVTFLICGPCLLVLALMGLFSGVVQTVTAIHETAISYAMKLAALVGLGLMFFIPMQEALVTLFIRAFRG